MCVPNCHIAVKYCHVAVSLSFNLLRAARHLSAGKAVRQTPRHDRLGLSFTAQRLPFSKVSKR